MKQITKQITTFAQAVEFVRAMFSEVHSSNLVAKTLGGYPGAGTATGKGPGPMQIGQLADAHGSWPEGGGHVAASYVPVTEVLRSR